MKTVRTRSGTELPLISLKGKDYLMVAYRIQWMNEDVPNFTIETNFSFVDDEQTIAHAKVTILNEKNEVVKSASASKRETKKDFTDHTEKAETAAVGRALAMLGYGTQFALSDLDEGERLADSPLAATKVSTGYNTTKESATPTTTARSSFRKPKKTDVVTTAVTEVANDSSGSGGWE